MSGNCITGRLDHQQFRVAGVGECSKQRHLHPKALRTMACRSYNGHFTQTTPPNTNFQSISTPAGWTCGTQPAVGGTVRSHAPCEPRPERHREFHIAAPSERGHGFGTNIAETATATANNIIPGLTTNSATASVVVANANSADLAIVKTATPSPTCPRRNSFYTLAVTNNGPASATNVTVTDALPATLTFLSDTPTSACSEANGP